MSKEFEGKFYKTNPSKHGIYHEYFEDGTKIHFGSTDTKSGFVTGCKHVNDNTQYVEFKSRESIKNFLADTDKDKTDHNSSRDDEFGFSQSKSLEHAIELMIDGDKSMMKEIVALAEGKLTEVIKKYADKEIGISRGVEGNYFDVDLVLQGEPESFYKSKDEQVPDKFLHLDINAGYSSSVNAETVKNNIVNIIVAISLLESIGHRISIDCWWTSTNERSNKPTIFLKYKLKSKLQALNIQSLVSVMHPSFFRRIMFRFYELFGTAESGYGVPFQHVVRNSDKKNILSIENKRSVEGVIEFIKENN
tara:strand:+ start:743 stop:1660 length:918 start_codon:yes stop_codon:yes gene_type:complete